MASKLSSKLNMFWALINQEYVNWISNSKYKRLKQSNVIAKLIISVFVFFSSFGYIYFPVFADTAGNAMGNLISVVLSIFRYVGAALFAWGAIQFILATKRSDADSKADAIQSAMCGIALMVLPTLINSLGMSNIIGTTKHDVLESGDL